MGTFENNTYREETIVLDGSVYRNCKFHNCQLIFRGGDLPILIGDEFHQCNWTFDGAASRTIEFMKALYMGGADDLIEETFQQIRQSKE